MFNSIAKPIICLILMTTVSAAELAAAPGASAATAGETVKAEEVIAAIESVLAPPNVKVVYDFVNQRLDGTTSQYQVRFEMKDPDHARGFFLKPDREKGREILRLKDEIWTYVPSAGRIVRIADRDSFAGGDFSNADVLKADWSRRYSSSVLKELPDQWIFELKAKNTEATYDSIRMWVDKKSRLPVQQIFYDSHGTKLKRLRYGNTKTFGTVTRPAKLVMENLITKQQSEMEVIELVSLKDIPDSRFIVDNLGK
jgi:outer membrane lipoprotein-sorting protein